jgi:serine protease Do
MKYWFRSIQQILLLAAVIAAPRAIAFEPQPGPVVITKPGGSYLGIGVQEIDAERAKELGLREVRGVEVTHVQDDSPAAKAGLKKGDVILEYNGQRLEGVEQFMRMVRETPPGREVKLTTNRSGSSQTVTVATAERKSWVRGPEIGSLEMPRFEIPELRLPDIPRPNMSWRSSVLGFEGEALDSQLAEYFGVKDGVLVRSVVKGSAADKAGLKAGDVIVRVGDTHVSTPREITAALRSARGQKSFQLHIVREKRELTLQAAVDDAQAETHAALRPYVVV